MTLVHHHLQRGGPIDGYVGIFECANPPPPRSEIEGPFMYFMSTTTCMDVLDVQTPHTHPHTHTLLPADTPAYCMLKTETHYILVEHADSLKIQTSNVLNI